MDAFSNSASLLQQVFHLYRHISSAKNFSDAAGSLSVLIAVEYLRFESWVQASGLITQDPATGEPVIHDHSLQRCILLAADANRATLDYKTVEETILRIISEVHRCLEKLEKLRKKYAMDLDSASTLSPTPPGQNSQVITPSLTAPAGLKHAHPLFSSPKIAATLSRDAIIRQQRSRAVSFFRKVNFGWSLSNDVSDKLKIEEAVKMLKDLNDNLELILPTYKQGENGTGLAARLISLKLLSIAAEPTELRNIGETMGKQAAHVELYQAIHTAAMIKAKRLEGGSSPSELQQMALDLGMIVGPQVPSKGIQTRTLCKMVSDGSVVLTEGTQYPESLPDTEIEVLKERIAGLALLLKLAGQPYFKALPSCHGYIRHGHTQFGLVYTLPDSADPTREPTSLYSLLPTTSRKNLDKFGMTKRLSRNTLPTLEERYRLAHALSDGILSLLSVSWLHKSLCSWNVLLFRSRTSQGTIDFDKPLIVGFGVSRREKPEEVTIDTRDLDSPLQLWQHPDLCGSTHVRFQPKYDLYSLGLILFEIAMWQDLPRLEGNGDLQTYVLNHSGIVAHRMGTTYRDAMMACLDDDSRWDEASAPGEGTMALAFANDVVAKLLLCVEGAKQ
ncbi:hypothetical protein FSPOR_7595 [Fusarium sporotrichioides]|uniref:Prion-inhibition and propagation HeLo domain-containing protein n=1 Tax=Fusarium sporotrichioides TaxID=5514 RepID=A0A395RY15_FUSSP|nr:hypothetical protein FSPOR_7595 [Fusarium sporotrichioides]